MFVFVYAVTAAFAFTQYKQVEFHSPMKFENAMSKYAYCEPTNVTIDDEKEILKNRMPSSFDENNMSKYQIEFRNLLTGILYTENELQAMLNPRTRAILEGITASYFEPDVYRAFEILYEDYIPLRIAGRVVYRQLRKVMDESKQYRQSQIDEIMEATEMSLSDIEICWGTFVQLTNEQKIPLGEAEACIGPQALNFVLNNSRVSTSAESDEMGAISFAQLLIGLYDYDSKYHGDESAGGFTESALGGNILQQALELNGAVDMRQLSKEQTLSEKRQKVNQRYDDMLVQFSKWKPLIPSGDGRRLQILKGCFVGSENPGVVEALRIIYVDYAALRLSGDWIFKVVSALMSPIVRRHNRRQKSSFVAVNTTDS